MHTPALNRGSHRRGAPEPAASQVNSQIWISRCELAPPGNLANLNVRRPRSLPTQPPHSSSSECSHQKPCSARSNRFLRVREAFELVAFTKLSTAEICEKMRPGKPMNSQTIGNYILKAFNYNLDFDGAAALFRPIGGREKLTDFVRSADPFRWGQANGYNAFMTNSKRVAGLCKSDIARKKLVRDIRKGTVLESDIEKEKHRILWAWTKDKIPTIPRSVAAQLVTNELARRRGLSQEQRLTLRKKLARMPALDGKSAYEGLHSNVMEWAEVVADIALEEARSQVADEEEEETVE
ncbi:hypothetical protein B0H19DRAFT_1274216 [Mycena capillaripes]|nr:hypothetical protein B0H19DRAFT_1274216 [Mycena capillaripes]